MPAYVSGYSNKEGPLLVEFDDAPGWKMAERWAAMVHCETLRNAQVRVGEHNCEFSIVEVESREFAIVCESHPLRVRALAP